MPPMIYSLADTPSPPVVECYARNDHWDFTIPYVDDFGNPHVHRSDIIVRLVSGSLGALEVKGQVRDLEE